MITQFLLSLPPGSVGLDIGCGNGKYFGINPEIYIIGSDRSKALLEIAREEKKDGANKVYLGDLLDLPHQVRAFDFAISIAVVHHLSTRPRRVQSIKSIIGTLILPEETAGRRGEAGGGAGRALFYVWALEQKNSRRGWDEGQEQDVMVPWVMRQNAEDRNKIAGETTYERYYHLYRKGELEDDIQEAGGSVVKSGYEKGNWWAIASPKPPG